MKRFTSLAIFVCISNCCLAQLHFNTGVDTLEEDIKAATHFYSDYINEFKDGLPDFKKYWSEEDCNAYKLPDQMVYAIDCDNPTYRVLGKPTVLYIKPHATFIHIKTAFAWADTSMNISINCITNHYIKKTQNGMRFIDPISMNGKDWHTTKVRNTTYRYPSYLKFNKKKADSLTAKIKSLEKEWNLQPINIRYFYADTYEEIDRLRGLDFSFFMGNRDKPSGISDDRDNIVYCAGLGEDYFHEVVHLYLNRLYPQSLLKEGLAAFYGGSMGHDLKWHIKRLNHYLEEHEEINLNDFENAGLRYMDNYSNPQSTIKALLCSIVYKKDGVQGLKRLMSYTTFDKIFKNEFDVLPENENVFIRKLVGEYSF